MAKINLQYVLEIQLQPLSKHTTCWSYLQGSSNPRSLALCSGICTEHLHTHWWQKVESLNI